MRWEVRYCRYKIKSKNTSIGEREKRRGFLARKLGEIAMSFRKAEGVPTRAGNARFQEVLLVGMKNQRLKTDGARSNAIGLMGGVQRAIDDVNNSKVESIALISMTAGFMETSGGKNVFKKAMSFDDAKGVFVTLDLGCFYNATQALDSSQKALVVKAGIRQLASIASNLFLNSMRREMQWYELAEAVQTKLDDELGKDNINVSEYQNGKAVTTQAEVKLSLFLSFDYQAYEIDANSDGRDAFTMPAQMSQFSQAVMNAVSASDYKFGKVCYKGNSFEVSLDLIAQELVKAERTSEMMAIADILMRV